MNSISIIIILILATTNRQTQIAQIRRGLFQVIKTRRRRRRRRFLPNPKITQTNRHESNQRNHPQKPVQNNNENIKFQIQIVRHKPARIQIVFGDIREVSIILCQDGRHADARAQRRQAEQVVNYVGGRQELLQLLLFVVQLDGKHTDDGQCGQRTRLKRVGRVENPYDSAAIVRVHGVLVQSHEKNVGKNGQVAEDAQD